VGRAGVSTQDATDFTLSEILAPLARHKGDMVGVQNLRKFSGYAHEYQACFTSGHQGRAVTVTVTGTPIACWPASSVATAVS